MNWVTPAAAITWPSEISPSRARLAPTHATPATATPPTKTAVAPSAISARAAPNVARNADWDGHAVALGPGLGGADPLQHAQARDQVGGHAGGVGGLGLLAGGAATQASRPACPPAQTITGSPTSTTTPSVSDVSSSTTVPATNATTTPVP